jgi:hypothetical protein
MINLLLPMQIKIYSLVCEFQVSRPINSVNYSVVFMELIVTIITV